MGHRMGISRSGDPHRCVQEIHRHVPVTIWQFGSCLLAGPFISGEALIN